MPHIHFNAKVSMVLINEKFLMLKLDSKTHLGVRRNEIKPLLKPEVGFQNIFLFTRNKVKSILRLDLNFLSDLFF